MARLRNQARPRPDFAPEAYIPPLDAAWFARALPHRGGKPLGVADPARPGRARTVQIQLPPALLARLMGEGPDWERRIGEILETWAEDHPLAGG